MGFVVTCPRDCRVQCGLPAHSPLVRSGRILVPGFWRRSSGTSTPLWSLRSHHHQGWGGVDWRLGQNLRQAIRAIANPRVSRLDPTRSGVASISALFDSNAGCSSFVDSGGLTSTSISVIARLPATPGVSHLHPDPERRLWSSKIQPSPTGCQRPVVRYDKWRKGLSDSVRCPVLAS